MVVAGLGRNSNGELLFKRVQSFVLQEEKSYRDGDGGNRTTL